MNPLGPKISEFVPPNPPPNIPSKIPDYATPKGANPDAGPLTSDQLRAIQRGHEGARKIRRAVNVANADAGLMAFFALGCLALAAYDVLSLFVAWSGKLGVMANLGHFDPSNLLMGIGLAAVTINSFRGARRLKNIDIGAPRLLAYNQLFLAIIIIFYALVSLYVNMTSTAVTDPQLAELVNDPTVGSVIGSTKDFYRLAMEILYTALILGTIVFQGLTGLYYYTRRGILQTYLEETPAWVIEVQKRQTAK